MGDDEHRERFEQRAVMLPQPSLVAGSMQEANGLAQCILDLTECVRVERIQLGHYRRQVQTGNEDGFDGGG